MGSTSRQDRCLRSITLAIICIFSITIGYVCLNYIGNEEKLDSGTSVVDIMHAEKLTDEKCIPVCSSKACVLHANTLLKTTDFTADPCENFDTFLCNNHKEKHGSETAANVVVERIAQMFSKFRGILENIQAKPDSASSKMKIVYDSCMNLKTSELKGLVDFKKFISELGFSNWPDLQEDYNLSSPSLPVVLGNLIAHGLELFFEISPNSHAVDKELQKNSFRILFSSSKLEDSTEILQAFLRRLLNYFDLDTVHIDTIINDHENVRKAVISLYEELDTCEEDCSDVHHINCSIINENEWRKVCETAEVYLEVLNLTDTMKAKLLILQKSQVDFFKNLFPFLDSLTHRSLANFLMLNFINKFQEELNFYFRLSKFKILDKDKKFKETGDIDRWRYCLQWIADNMNGALINEFFHQYLTPPVDEEIHDLYKDIQYTLIDIINHQKWMPLEMKSELEMEMKNMMFNVDVLSQVYPNDTFANSLYEKFHPTFESFFNNVLRHARLENILMIYLPKMQWNLNAWAATKMTKLAINAEFAISLLVIHYGMLLPPYFFPGNERQMNRMLMAHTISHEFGHYIHVKFQMSLHQYPEIHDTYTESVQCVQNQLSKFKLKILNRNLNGSIYTAESVPDNIATAVIDKIWEKYYSTLENLSLPGLPFNAEQLLFMSAFEGLCSKANLENEMKHYEGKLVHPPPEFRIIGSTQNSKEFSKAFHCPERNFTDAPKKCSFFDNY